jgi:hypothetical protein
LFLEKDYSKDFLPSAAPFISFKALETSDGFTVQDWHKTSSLYIDNCCEQDLQNFGFVSLFLRLVTAYLSAIFSLVAAFLQSTEQ